MKSVIVIMLCVLFVPLAEGGNFISDEEKRGLVGVYEFEGMWNGRPWVAEQVFTLDDQGNLFMSGETRTSRYRAGDWQRFEWTKFRRLSTYEWENEWEILTLSGSACDLDRYCYVVDEEISYWTNNRKIPGSSMNQFCLFQITVDFTAIEQYCVLKQGQGGWLAFPLQRNSRKSVPYQESIPAEIPNSKQNTSTSKDGSNGSSDSYDVAIELEYWKLVRDGNDVELFQAYLDEYPNGKFAPLARLKIKKLKSN